MRTISPARLLLAFAFAVSIAGCGVKGAPELASDKPDLYPRVYPAGAVPPQLPPESIYVERWRPL